eukprot:753320-Hanusia_phi.AAC.4
MAGFTVSGFSVTACIWHEGCMCQVQLKYVVPNEEDVRMPMLLGCCAFKHSLNETNSEIVFLRISWIVHPHSRIPILDFVSLHRSRKIAQRQVRHKMKWEYFCGAVPSFTQFFMPSLSLTWVTVKALVFVSFVGVNTFGEDQKQTESPDLDMDSNLVLQDARFMPFGCSFLPITLAHAAGQRIHSVTSNSRISQEPLSAELCHKRP